MKKERGDVFDGADMNWRKKGARDLAAVQQDGRKREHCRGKAVLLQKWCAGGYAVKTINKKGGGRRLSLYAFIDYP